MKKLLLLLLLSNFSLMHSQTIINIVTSIDCNGDNNGSISVITTGGTPPYTYFLMTGGSTIVSGPLSSGVFTNLPAGVYTTMVVDATTSSDTEIAVITEPTVLLCSATVSGNSVTGTASGGTPPYLYSVDFASFQSNPNFTFLSPGNYTMIVLDAFGCLKTIPFTIPVLSNATSKFDNFNFSFDSNTSLFSFSNNSTIEDLTVYSILGEKVISKKFDLSSSQLDLSNLSKGIYLVKLSSENQEKTVKIIRN